MRRGCAAPRRRFARPAEHPPAGGRVNPGIAGGGVGRGMDAVRGGRRRGCAPAASTPAGAVDGRGTAVFHTSGMNALRGGRR